MIFGQPGFPGCFFSVPGIRIANYSIFVSGPQRTYIISAAVIGHRRAKIKFCFVEIMSYAFVCNMIIPSAKIYLLFLINIAVGKIFLQIPVVNALFTRNGRSFFRKESEEQKRIKMIIIPIQFQNFTKRIVIIILHVYVQITIHL